MKKMFALIPGLVVAALIAGVGTYFALGSHFKIKTVELSLSSHSEETELFEEIKEDLLPLLNELKGQSMLKLSFPTLMDRIFTDPRVKNIHLKREFPAALHVQIEPHETVAAWADEKGFVRPVAKTNRILPRLKSSLGKDFALLRGKEFFEDEALRSSALALLRDLPLEGHFRKALVSEIRHSKASGFDLILSDPSIVVKIGTDDVQNKSARVEKVLSYLHHRGIKGRVIDSRFDKKVVVRLRNEP